MDLKPMNRRETQHRVTRPSEDRARRERCGYSELARKLEIQREEGLERTRRKLSAQREELARRARMRG
jgi:hypothetical protein